MAESSISRNSSEFQQSHREHTSFCEYKRALEALGVRVSSDADAWAVVQGYIDDVSPAVIAVLIEVGGPYERV
jgi:hypothetical protein